jgi:hypothetical protein
VVGTVLRVAGDAARSPGERTNDGNAGIWPHWNAAFGARLWLRRGWRTDGAWLWVWPWLLAGGLLFFVVVEVEKLVIRSSDALRKTVTAVEAGT